MLCMHSEELQNIGIFFEMPKSPLWSLDMQYAVASKEVH
jgi:hypothetical protein